MKPKGSFIRSRSAGREAPAEDRDRSLSFASISNAVGIPTAKDFAGVRIGLEKEKKEADSDISVGPQLICQVRQIRGIESQLKWDMHREERSQTEEERREEALRAMCTSGLSGQARQIMEWREREAKEMRLGAVFMLLAAKEGVCGRAISGATCR